MLVYPLSRFTDQKGNAARVAFHQLGKLAAVEDSVLKIEADIDEMLSDPIHKQKVSAMQRVFKEYDDKSAETIDFIEAYLSEVTVR